jgi:hypothetical protein
LQSPSAIGVPLWETALDINEDDLAVPQRYKVDWPVWCRVVEDLVSLIE